MKLITLNVDGVSDLFKTMKELQTSPHLENYIATIRKNNITGSVLFYCDLDDLKKVYLHFNDHFRLVRLFDYLTNGFFRRWK